MILKSRATTNFWTAFHVLKPWKLEVPAVVPVTANEYLTGPQSRLNFCRNLSVAEILLDPW